MQRAPGSQIRLILCFLLCDLEQVRSFSGLNPQIWAMWPRLCNLCPPPRPNAVGLLQTVVSLGIGRAQGDEGETGLGWEEVGVGDMLLLPGQPNCPSQSPAMPSRLWALAAEA